MITPIIGIVFDRDRLSQSSKVVVMTAREKRLRKLKQCVAPFTITIILCITLSVLALFEDIRLQVSSIAYFMFYFNKLIYSWFKNVKH